MLSLWNSRFADLTLPQRASDPECKAVEAYRSRAQKGHVNCELFLMSLIIHGRTINARHISAALWVFHRGISHTIFLRSSRIAEHIFRQQLQPQPIYSRREYRLCRWLGCLAGMQGAVHSFRARSTSLLRILDKTLPTQYVSQLPSQLKVHSIFVQAHGSIYHSAVCCTVPNMWILNTPNITCLVM